jgi:CBS domain-containing protein
MKVSELMRQPVIVIHESGTLEQAARLMLQYEVRGLPVVDNKGEICGFISVSDYLAKMKGFPFSRFKAAQIFGQWVPNEGIETIYEEARTLSVKQIMSTPAFTVHEDETVEQLVELMTSHNLNRIPVVRGCVPVGIVARFDLLKLMVR